MAKLEVPTWRVRNIKTGYVKEEAALVAYWEAYADPMSDDYLPSEISAAELFWEWERRVAEDHPNGLVPIYWYIGAAASGILEGMPHQYPHDGVLHDHNFLTFYDHPEDPATGRPLNWLELPVEDKLWSSEHADKGGFIQEATGWKPSALQPFVYLPSLTSAVHS